MKLHHRQVATKKNRKALDKTEHGSVEREVLPAGDHLGSELSSRRHVHNKTNFPEHSSRSSAVHQTAPQVWRSETGACPSLI